MYQRHRPRVPSNRRIESRRGRNRGPSIRVARDVVGGLDLEWGGRPTATMSRASADEAGGGDDRAAPVGLRQRPFTADDDALIRAMASKRDYRDVDWKSLTDMLPGRSETQIRARWRLHLDPIIDHSPFGRRDVSSSVVLRFLFRSRRGEEPRWRLAFRSSCAAVPRGRRQRQFR